MIDVAVRRHHAVPLGPRAILLGDDSRAAFGGEHVVLLGQRPRPASAERRPEAVWTNSALTATTPSTSATLTRDGEGPERRVEPRRARRRGREAQRSAGAPRASARWREDIGFGGAGRASARPGGGASGRSGSVATSRAGTLTRPPPRARRRAASRSAHGGSPRSRPADGCSGFFVRTARRSSSRNVALHDAVLERVVREHDHAATGSEEPDRLRQGGGELLELPVDRDAERLERAARGVGAPRTSSHGAHDDAGEFVGAS